MSSKKNSRACMQGPAQERCDVVYFPISQASGLHLVHPTWAGTFVLAALCLVFPGLHIVLLDSDCVPVTLFEVEDLWQEAQRLQHSGFPGLVPTSSCAGGLNLDPTDQTPTPKVPKEQGVMSIMLRSMQDSWYYGVPTMLLRSLKLIGKASRSAQATCRTGLLANIGRGWWRPTGNLSPKWSRTDGMTGT